jgi:glycosyltransferase involved in cell wall biosynthesis
MDRWQRAARIPLQEEVGGLDVRHPKYFLLPKVSMPFHGRLMFLGCRQLALRLHRESRIDCIDAHFVYPDGFAACLLGRMLGVPVIVSARGTDLTLYPSFRTIRPLIRWMLKSAAGLIAVSESLKIAMLALGAPESKIRVIPNGIDETRFFPEDRFASRKKLGLPTQGEMIVSIGSLLPVKGHERLIAAMAVLKVRQPNLRAYIVGEGPLRAKLQRSIASAGLAEHVFLIGSRANEELRFWFSAADVSCLTSLREGWPNVVSESIACGTPVVATAVGGVPEIIYSSDLGIVVESTVAGIAAGLDSALSRTWNREALAAHARKRTWHQVAEEVQEFCRERLASGQKLETELPESEPA